MNEEQIAQLVRDYLQNCEANGSNIELLENAIHQDGDWWYVPVHANDQTPKTYGFYEELTNIENALREDRQVNVLLVPSA